MYALSIWSTGVEEQGYQSISYSKVSPAYPKERSRRQEIHSVCAGNSAAYSCSKKDCLFVAGSLVRQYPFLKDPVSKLLTVTLVAL